MANPIPDPTTFAESRAFLLAISLDATKTAMQRMQTLLTNVWIENPENIELLKAVRSIVDMAQKQVFGSFSCYLEK